MRGGLEETRPAESAAFVGTEPPVGGAWPRRVLSRYAIVVLASLVVFVGLWIFLYALSIHGNPVNSDGATVVLEGQSMANGQVALHGWSLSFDSFWGVDAVVYAVAVAIAGVKASFLHLIPALIAAAVAVAGGLIARNGVRGAAGFAGAASVVALLGFPPHALALDLLQGPLHIATTLWCIAAFVAVRTGKFDWRWAIAVVLLAAGLLGDLQTLALGTVPLFLAGAVASARCRRVRAGIPAASAAIASVALALIVREIAKALGTFSLIAPNPRAPWSAVFANLKLFVNYFPKLLGAGTTGFGSNGAPYFTEFARGLGLIAVVAGVLAALGGLIVGIRRGDGERSEGSAAWRVEDPIVLAFFGGVVVFLALTVQPIGAYARYLAPSAIFGAILAGRLITRLAGRISDRREEIPRSILSATIGAFAVVVAVLIIGAAYEIDTPAPPTEYQTVGTFLAAHGLHQGVGDYWSASIVTVDSNDSVRVRAVTEAPDGKLVRYDRESTTAWYSGQKFEFLVFNPTLQFGNVNTLTAEATYGRPEKTYQVDGLVVLVWRHPFTVSTKGIA